MSGAEQRLGVKSEFFQEPKQLRPLSGSESGGDGLEGGGVIAEGAGNEAAAVGRQMDLANPAIGVFPTPFHQSFLFQTVDRRGEGAAGEQDFFSDGMNWLGAFVQQRLENGKIRPADAERIDAAQGMRLNRPGGLPEHQPHMNPRGIRIRFHHGKN